MNIKPANLPGSYRLHVAPIHIQIKNSQLKILNSPPLKFILSQKSEQVHHQHHRRQIKLILQKSEPQLQSVYQKIVNLFQEVDQLQHQGHMLRFYCNNKLLMRGSKNNQYTSTHTETETFEGFWNMDLHNLALEVDEQKFIFAGIDNNEHILSYKLSAGNKIQLQYELTQQKIEELSNKNKLDLIFILSLIKSRSYKLGQVSFELFDLQGKLTAKGTPYM